jgi:hypothetical protein
MYGRITFRLSKSGQTLFKQRSYQIRINGNSIGHIDSEQNTLSEQFPMGMYTIEVSEHDFFIRRDLVLAVGQMQTVTINPSSTFAFTRSFLIGIAICAVGIIGYMAVENKIIPQIFPLLFVPLVPVLIFRKKHYGERFALTISKTQL